MVVKRAFFFIFVNTMTNCLNCNHPLTEGQHFCANCGQKAALKRLNLHDIWHDVVHYFTHADKGIFQLLKQLVTKTGIVAKEYVEGKRKKYFPPLNFFLIVAALYVFMESIVPKPTSTVPQSATTSQYKNSTQTTGSTAAYKTTEKRMAVGRFLSKYANFVAMFAAPFISLIIWLIYKRGPYNFTEHLVANLYLIGFTNLIRCLIWIPALALLHIHPRVQWPNYLFALFEIGYRTIFYYRFMNEPGNKGVFKSLAIAILSVVAWWALIAGLIFVYIMI